MAAQPAGELAQGRGPPRARIACLLVATCWTAAASGAPPAPRPVFFTPLRLAPELLPSRTLLEGKLSSGLIDYIKEWPSSPAPASPTRTADRW
ncbi:MAG: hypothetical protein FJ125_00230 [Deltaproteobacteria bacterium]|nr:hypothetical protein [Deltaproteobacteria bacterium]